LNSANFYEYLLNSKEVAKLIVAKDEKSAKRAKDIATFLGFKAFVLPSLRLSVGEDLRSYDIEKSELLVELANFYKAEGKKLLISPFYTLSLPLPKSQYFSSFKLAFGDKLNLEGFREKLYRWGYEFVDLVTKEGEVSIRGDIIDIFPPNSKTPYRINLFDDEIESIFIFNVDNQRVFKDDELEEVEIYPAFLSLDSKSFQELKERVENSPYESFIKDINSLGLWHLEDLGVNLLDEFKSIALEDIKEELNEFYSFNRHLIPKESYPKEVIPEAREYKEIEPVDFNKLIESHLDKKITVIAKSKSLVRGSELKHLDRLNFVYFDGIFNLISPKELILSINRDKKQKRLKRPLLVLDELRVGEYVVHENHGVGIFKGIKKREVLGSTREFVEIAYQGEDRLYLPVENLDSLDRYIADSGSLPSVDKLGKASFKRLKQKVRQKLFAIASEIINISANRLLKRGIVLDIDELEHKLFLSQAGFEHTQDQLRAISDILDDLRSGRVMDRLLSADVGFGKTEVAMNAIFAVAKNGYQSAMVAPTTLLSSQHFKTLKERFESWNIEVEKLDRFTSPAKKREILKRLEEGDLKVVVGTHALLSAKFKNLALVVVDEEHKFGVKQKEALKKMALDVHLLSMSATPIPRSLNMALSQIKSFSEILTPPSDRVGVRTFVKSYEPSIVKEAILRERRRGGQCFYIYNSIAEIEQKAKELRELIPDIRVSVLHSKVSSAQTEKEMLKFEAGEYDILLSTTIVESGIHLPNANTIIVDGAERFGIADLHQLRGRVGRGKKEGYCYLLVEDKEALNTNAKKRLLALETHSELGSGATLAFFDLQIRGGGNLIGEAQSGHIKQIGYSLYLRMLEDAIKELSGREDKTTKQSVDINLQIDAYLSDELIPEDRLRLELYRRLAQAKSIAEVYDIEEEISERFGKLDTITRQFIESIVIKVLAKQKGVSKVSSYGERVFIEFSDGRDRVILNSLSKDDDDILDTALKYLKNLK